MHFFGFEGLAVKRRWVPRLRAKEPRAEALELCDLRLLKLDMLEVGSLGSEASVAPRGLGIPGFRVSGSDA